MFCTPDQNMVGALGGRRGVFYPSASLRSSDNEANLFVCTGNGWISQYSFGLSIDIYMS
jgi:hypothetical protein